MSAIEVRKLAGAAVALSAVAAAPARSNGVQPAGWVEYASLYPGGLVYSAKLDSGARTTSVHATGIQLFKRDGADWVTFRLKGDDGTQRAFEMPVARVSRTRDMTGPPIVRPVVKLTVCVGGISAPVDVNLSNRTGFNHGLLVGRNFLRGRFMIDSGNRHLLKLACPSELPK
jgi:hypothetical protein